MKYFIAFHGFCCIMKKIYGLFERMCYIMCKFIPKLIFFNGAELLEGPCWEAETESLYFVSIKADTVFRFNTKTGRIKSYATDGAVGCAVLRDGKLITAEKSGIYERKIDDTEKQLIAHVYDDNIYRYNDGKLDPKGRLFVGTMGDGERQTGKCGLYRIDGENEFTCVVSGTTISNGLGWTKDSSKMFFIDTPTKEVWEFDYDLETGEISNKKVFTKIEDGAPDGMCVDIDDTLWIAHWGGSKVSHWDSRTGEYLGEIELPVSRVSCPVVGGKMMDTLYITTALDPDGNEPLSGGLFAVKIR